MESFNSEELQRYVRHFSVGKIGVAGQKKLRESSVLLVGVGGIGSPAALYLCAAGIGRLGLIDGDTVELSNLQRQVIYQTSDCGYSKTAISAQKLKALNPHCQVEAHAALLTHDNAIELISSYDVVIDGSDNFPTRYLVNDACATQKIPLISASVYQFSGQLLVFDFKEQEPCYRCLYSVPPAPELIPNCAESGVLGIVPGMLGSLAANEALKYLLELPSEALNRLTVFDALTVDLKKYPIPPNPHCPICAYSHSYEELPKYAIQQAKTHKRELEIDVHTLYQWRCDDKPLVLFDVREDWERQICHISEDRPLKLSDISTISIAPNIRIIVYCKSGVRSLKAVEMLRASGLGQAVSLNGGILAWAKEIEPAMSVY